MRRLVILVSAIVLLDTAFYSAVAPLLPHYVDELDLSKSAAGILTGSYAAGCFLGTLPAIWIAGRLGVKRAALAGLVGLAVSSLVFGLAREVWLLDATRFVQGIASACTWTAAFAWVVERAPAERRGEVIGTPLAAAIAGALLGPVLGTAAAELGPELVFSCVAGTALVLAAFALREPGVPSEGSTELRHAGAALGRPGVRLGIWLVALPALASGVLNVLVPLRLDALGATSFAIGAIYFIAAGIESAMSPFVGRLSDRRGRLVPIRAGLMGVAGLLVLLPLAESAPLLAVIFIITALSSAAFWAPAMALLSDEIENARVQQAASFAFTNVAWSIGQVIGNAGGSSLAEATADWVSYTIVAVLCALTLAAVSLRAPARSAAAWSSSPHGRPPTP